MASFSVGAAFTVRYLFLMVHEKHSFKAGHVMTWAWEIAREKTKFAVKLCLFETR